MSISSFSTAHTIAAFVEYIRNRTNRSAIGDVSRLFLYYNGRKQDQRNNKEEEGEKKKTKDAVMIDDGCPIIAAVEALKKYGYCPESEWTYKKKQKNIEPPKNCYRSAKRNRNLEALKLHTNLDEMKSCLAQGFPIIFGLDLYPSFGKAKYNGGAVPMPRLNKPSDHS